MSNLIDIEPLNLRNIVIMAIKTISLKKEASSKKKKHLVAITKNDIAIYSSRFLQIHTHHFNPHKILHLLHIVYIVANCGKYSY
jgi:hypothetical protein